MVCSTCIRSAKILSQTRKLLGRLSFMVSGAKDFVSNQFLTII